MRILIYGSDVTVGLTALFTVLWAGCSAEECKHLLLLAVGGTLCALFVGLIFKTFCPKNQEK